MPRLILVASVALLVAFASSGVLSASLCFTDGMPTDRYHVDAGEVHDTRTGLIWQRCSVGQRWSETLGCVGVIKQLSWEDAMKQSNEGWQLPSKEELSTLLEAACGSPALDERAFPDMELVKLWYWTRSRDGALAWYVAFGGGSARSGGPLALNSVRLVRRYGQ